MRALVILVAACGGSSVQAVVAPMQTIEATAVATTVPFARDDISPPWSLTASDGSGLKLVRIDAKAVIEGPLAFTELHLWFRNTENRQREGMFQITLPEHAAISRFAMENNGQWMEAEVVPKLAARRAYEDFLHRRQDPALLEKAAGNQFTARVFPILPRAEKHLVISYSQELPGRRYVLPLRGLPRAERVDVTLGAQTLSERDWTADRDFISSAPTTAAAVGADNLVAAQVELVAATTRDVPTGITLLVDTSASRGLGWAHYVAQVDKLVDELRVPVQIVAFDQTTQAVDRAQLAARGAAGASDLAQAFAWLAKHGTKQRIVIVTDGVITAGTDPAIAAKQLAAERIDVVLVGGLRDERTAAALVTARPRAGAVLDLDTDPVARALGESVATNIAITVPGATWSYPRHIASARAGTKVTVFARLPARRPAITIVANGVRHVANIAPGTAPLIERAIASAEIEELEASLSTVTGDARAQLRSAIAKKSLAARVLSRETSLLVLESERDYPRYGIDRKALADVLVVGAGGIERVRRADLTPIPMVARSTMPADTVEPRAPQPRTTRVVTGDTDHDAVVDVEDRCPSDPETLNAFEDDDGCPDRGRIVVTNASIIILEAIHFTPRSDTLAKTSYPILDAVAQALLAAPSIELVEVQGHTDDRGDGAANLALSDRRARAVRDYLIAQGVQTERLQAQGYGETQPIDRRSSSAAHAKNRRVDFLILRRTIDGKPPSYTGPPPVTGELAAIQAAIAKRDLDGALDLARAWHDREPGNVLALVGLGETLEARGDANAARIYGSIIDLFPGRADLRRFAGQRLGRLANDLAIDTYRRAVADRPDHLTGHRLLAYALVRAGKLAEAFTAITTAIEQAYRPESFRGGKRVIAEDASMIAAAYVRATPAQRLAIEAVLKKHGLAIATRPSTRFVAYWETDANDVDLHVVDARGGHASYSSPKLPSGGELYADVTNGYGPECFAIDGTATAGPYALGVHYYAQGPMGYGMGLVQIQTFDPARGFSFDDRPYVVMTPQARIELGVTSSPAR
jgi:outer membrane protein OmpA-like peptidoglycan-associated protein